MSARRKSWLPMALLAATLLALIGGGAWWLRHMKGGIDAPRRQTAKISLLPDTPPPPPPPKEEKKPEPPKDEPKQVVHEEQVKQAEAPKAAEPIKMEGAAGEGGSAFAAGSVGKEYSGGTPGTGATGGTGSDRAQERFFANTAKQMLRDEIERRLKGDADQLVASFSIWVAKDGAIERYELQPTGNAGNDAALRAALDATRAEFKLPPPPAISQPMRFRLNVRPQA